MVGEIVKSGGVRRAALICFSDPDDLEMRHAKDWSRGGFPEYRYMANLSAFWEGRPERDIFDEEWAVLRNGGSGERGFYMIPPERREQRGDMRSNPCGEILLRYAMASDPWTGEGGGGQFCNLSAAVMRAEDTVESFAEKIRVATWIGAIQASFTDFPYLRPTWKKHCDEDRLLGVDITGHCDNPALSNNEKAMTYFNRHAIETAGIAAAHLNIPMAASVACGKPSGNSSQAVDCASGFHTRFAKFYIRRVRVSATDPLFHLTRDAGAPVFKDVKYKNGPDSECPTWVVEFPVKAPEGCMTRDDETALEQLTRYLKIMRTWLSDRGHNQSATVYVRDHEWDAVGNWLYEHFNEVTGLSFLPYDGGNYELAPYEEITEAEFTTRNQEFPTLDYRLLDTYETEDMGTGAQTLACVGGSCEIDWEALVPADDGTPRMPAG
jgi:ribonucleoside-diphosphate reductase alpha chain